MGKIICFKFTQKMTDLSKAAKLIQKERLFKANTKPTGLFYFFKQFPLQYLKQFVYFLIELFYFFKQFCLQYLKQFGYFFIGWLPIHMKTGHIGSALFRIAYKQIPLMTLSGRKKLLCEEKALGLYTFFLTSFFFKTNFLKNNKQF